MDAFYWAALIAFLTAMGLLIEKVTIKKKLPYWYKKITMKNPMTPKRKRG